MCYNILALCQISHLTPMNVSAKNCKKCGSKLDIRAVKKNSSQHKKPYYYTHYYYCTTCASLFHDNTFKVMNTSLFESIPNTKENSRLRMNENRRVSISSGNQPSLDAEIWTDGACVHNGTSRAKSAWAFVSGEVEQSGIVQGAQTNNRGEAYAIYYALKWAGENGAKKIKIYTDSQISIYGATKHFSKVIANREIFEGIAKIIAQYGLEVAYEKVLGHSGDPNNERADVLANTTAVNAV